MFKFRVTSISEMIDGKYVVQLREVGGNGNASVTVAEVTAKTLHVSSEFTLHPDGCFGGNDERISVVP